MHLAVGKRNHHGVRICICEEPKQNAKTKTRQIEHNKIQYRLWQTPPRNYVQTPANGKSTAKLSKFSLTCNEDERGAPFDDDAGVVAKGGAAGAAGIDVSVVTIGVVVVVV